MASFLYFTSLEKENERERKVQMASVFVGCEGESERREKD